MREIKFREWNTKHKRFMDGATISPVPTKEPYKYLSSECIIMQYIGLKDKNGVEIYEGDVVHKWDTIRGNDWRDERVFHQTGTVDFSNGQFTFVTENVPEQLVDLYESQDTSLEVIGNIYQNPELLEEAS